MSRDYPADPATIYALTAPPAPLAPALTGDIRAAVAIVGGGFTGLSAALHLAEAGIDSLVLESGAIGWGASGRNGGQVNPGLKIEPGEAYRKFGPEIGGRLVRAADQAPSYVFDLIQRHDIPCEAARTGTIRVVRTLAEAGAIETSIADWAREGVALKRLEGAALAARLGTGNYPLGLFDHRGGNLNPLAYCRGLAAAAQRAGARIHEHSKVVKLARAGDGWRLETARGQVRADRILLATNGYSDDLWPGLKRSVVPFYSAIAATAPLAAEIAARILPGRVVAYESSWRVMYWRLDQHNRLLMGGPGVQRDSANPADYRHLIRCALGLYPDLAGVDWTHRWSGQVAVSDDHLPHVHELAPGAFAALGYTGRGIALATVMGRDLARRLTGTPSALLSFPVTPLKPIRLQRFWRPVASFHTWRAALCDRARGLV